MLPSLHDYLLVSYEVLCEARELRLRARPNEPGQAGEIIEFVFTGVEGYHFENDAFGNIIYHLEEVSPETILSENAAQLEAGYKQSGWPGPWAGNLATALSYLQQRGVRGFVLEASFGMSGWVLASNVRAQQGAQPGRAQTTARAG